MHRADHAQRRRPGRRRSRPAGRRCAPAAGRHPPATQRAVQFPGWTPSPPAGPVEGWRSLFATLGMSRDSDVLDSGVAAELAKVGAPPLTISGGRCPAPPSSARHGALDQIVVPAVQHFPQGRRGEAEHRCRMQRPRATGRGPRARPASHRCRGALVAISRAPRAPPDAGRAQTQPVSLNPAMAPAEAGGHERWCRRPHAAHSRPHHPASGGPRLQSRGSEGACLAPGRTKPARSCGEAL